MAHPGWVNFIYFLAAVLVSLWADPIRRLVAGPIRRLLSLPIFYSLLGMLFLMRRGMKNRLDITRLVEGSAFKLVAYIGFYCADSLVWALGTAALMWSGLYLMDLHRHIQTPRDPFYVGVLGYLIIRTIKLGRFLGGLLHPEGTKWIEEALSKDLPATPKRQQDRDPAE